VDGATAESEEGRVREVFQFGVQVVTVQRLPSGLTFLRLQDSKGAPAAGVSIAPQDLLAFIQALARIHTQQASGVLPF
jgi:hypothetical protein